MTTDHPSISPVTPRLGPGVSIAGYSREQTVSYVGSWFGDVDDDLDQVAGAVRKDGGSPPCVSLCVEAA